MNVLLYTAKSLCILNQAVKQVKSFLPTHIQSLVWFNIDPKTNHHEHQQIYSAGSPHLSWGSQWEPDAATDAFPTTGYFLWVFWDANTSRRYYACLAAEEMKGVLYESSCKTYNDLYLYHPKALLERLKRFIHTDSIVHRRDHTMLELFIHKTPKNKAILKQFQNYNGLEECLYISHNLTAAAIQWLALWMELGMKKLANHTIHLTPLTVIDCEFEERTVKPDEFLFP
jgi:hypothetical protein